MFEHFITVLRYDHNHMLPSSLSSLYVYVYEHYNLIYMLNCYRVQFEKFYYFHTRFMSRIKKNSSREIMS